MSRSSPVAKHGSLVRRLLGGYAVASYIYLFLPVGLIVLFSFNANRSGTLPIIGLTIEWYRRVFADVAIQDAFWSTIQVAVQVTVISTLVGTAAAFPLARARFPFRSGVRLLFTLPIMVPALLIGVGLLILFSEPLQTPLSLGTVVVAQSVLITPFVILLVSAQLQRFDEDLERAASDLGANTWQRLRFVVLPLIMPSIVSAMCFAFVLSVDEFIVTLFTIGPGQNTLPIYIYTQIRLGITPAVNAIVSLMLVGSLLVLALGAVLPRLVRRALRRTRDGRRFVGGS